MKKAKDSKKTSSKNSKKTTNRINLDNEIVIGLTKVENSGTKTQNKKVNNKKKSSKPKTKNIKKTKKKNNTKRRVNADVSQADVIFETKKEKKKLSEGKKKIIKISILIFFIILLIVATMMSPLFNIKEINIEGNNQITKEEIISLSQINFGENTFRTNLGKAEKNILENAHIDSVTISRGLPDKIFINIEERKTTFMLEYGGGYVYINNQGYIIEVSDQKLEVPIIQGAGTTVDEFKPGNRLQTEDLEKLSIAIKIVETAQVNDIANLITGIDIENKQNYKIIFEGEQKVAYIGDGSDLNTKMLNIKSILEREKDIPGEIFINMDLKTSYPTFRQTV